MPAGDTFGVLYRNNINYSHDAAVSISYDNTSSGLDSTDVQAAIDELATASVETYGTHYKVFDVTGTGQGSSAVAANTNFTTTHRRAARVIASGKYILKIIFCVSGTGDYDTSANMTALTFRTEGNYPLVLNTRDNPTHGSLLMTTSADTSTGVITFKFNAYPSSPAMKLYRVDVWAI